MGFIVVFNGLLSGLLPLHPKDWVPFFHATVPVLVNQSFYPLGGYPNAAKLVQPHYKPTLIIFYPVCAL